MEGIRVAIVWDHYKLSCYENACTFLLVDIHTSLRYSPRNGSPRSPDRQIFNFSKYCQSFQSGNTNLRSCKQHATVLVAPHPGQHM